MVEVVHRDLKPENILLTDNSADCILKVSRPPSAPSELQQISDFGLAKALAKGRECRTNCGTPKYMAPEVFAVGRGSAEGLKKYGKEADLWGLGVILYVMLTCSMPFGGEDDEDLEEEMIQIAHGKKMYADLFNCDAWETKSKEVKNMISQLLEPDMQKRLTVEAARKHRWMREEEKG
ncbi:hypothetical protein GUITHDRAFT_101878 [Guillardia theta CCMP2712]|uniref:Protein kinase domain-containing protein n=1 Tax=Guillardia theta (strain CCMP2712) TaxID=905079 RepID=L1JWJ0_GUITC|nr:hypothetical protein GUITHDRAFT_101878 [Guillardia theta CCMP2712]EKX52727.1 hypothetical protein GUITHDRAFT_101878 [Guillardia theta CCMP2712]|eukprot:XP_005839707.1 hypothetical protein GUITHDRAFT_101878 [Guillardia theta CCMP2712]